MTEIINLTIQSRHRKLFPSWFIIFLCWLINHKIKTECIFGRSVFHRQRVHSVTRQSRGITRKRNSTIPNIFTRIRVLTPAEINQRLLNHWNFVQIETVQQPRQSPPPLVQTPCIFHGERFPTRDIIEFSIQQEESILPDVAGPSNLPITTFHII